jgi:hypothetical protein
VIGADLYSSSAVEGGTLFVAVTVGLTAEPVARVITIDVETDRAQRVS